MFYMVCIEGQQGPTKQHDTEEKARNEAERLARLPENAGHQVYVLEPVGVCVAVPTVEWNFVA